LGRCGSDRFREEAGLAAELADSSFGRLACESSILFN
jgi:hypothetical protein